MYKLKIDGKKLIKCESRNFPGKDNYDEIAVVPDNVEEICDRAFYQCAFADIILPDGIKKIGDYAFDRATSPNNKRIYKGGEYIGSKQNPYMVLIDIHDVDDEAIEVHHDTRFIDSGVYKKERWWYKHAPKLVLGDKLEFIGNYAFWGAKFTHVEIPESVVCINKNAFYDNSELLSAVLPSKLETVASMLFLKCKSLKSVVLPQRLVSIGDRAFADCSALTEMMIPSGVKEIGSGVFVGCSSLKKVVFGDDVEKIGADAFRDCVELEEVVMPAALEEISQGMFLNCVKLTAVNIPDGAKRIGKDAFSGCSSLEALHIPRGVVSIDGAFDHCDALKCVTVDPKNKHYFMRGNSLIEKSTDRPVWIGDDGIAEDVYIAGAGKSVIEFEEYKNNTFLETVRVAPTVKLIKSSAFRGCSKLKHIELPEGLEELEHDVFVDCVSLEDITIPAHVKELGFNMFDGCTSLKTVVIKGALDCYPSFENCTSLTSITAKSLGSTGYKSFENCTALKDITLPADLRTVSEGSFSGCTALERIVIPAGVDYIGDKAFGGCTALKEVVIKSKNMRIREFAFKGCKSLHSFTIGEGVRLGIAALGDCDGLKSVTVSPDNALYYVRDDCLFTRDDTLIWMPMGRESLPEGIKGIGGGLFSYSNMEKFTVPDGVERIEDEAFAYSALKEITLPSSVKYVSLDSFDECFDIRTIYFNGTRYEFNCIDFGEDEYDPSNESEYYFNLVKGLDYTGQIDVVCRDDN